MNRHEFYDVLCIVEALGDGGVAGSLCDGWSKHLHLITWTWILDQEENISRQEIIEVLRRPSHQRYFDL